MGASSGKVGCGKGLFKKGWVINDVGMLRIGWLCCGFAKVWFGVCLLCLGRLGVGLGFIRKGWVWYGFVKENLGVLRFSRKGWVWYMFVKESLAILRFLRKGWVWYGFV